MKLTVVSCANHTALDTAVMDLMKKYNSDAPGDTVLIVPDQSTFSQEKKLIDAFGTVGLGNPEVLSFKRMFFNLGKKYPSGRKRLTPAAREMAVAHSLNAIDPEDFRLFKGVIKRRELAPSVSGLITGFKRYGVTVEKLRLADHGLPQNSPLQKKIHDCCRALESYDRFMTESGLSDADDDMCELSRILNLDECDFFEGKTVFVSMFSDLNRMQLSCIGGICRRAARVIAAVCWEDKPEFATTKKLINSLARTARENGAEFEHRPLMGYKDTRPDPLVFLSANYYSDEKAVYDKTVDRRIFIHSAKTPADEVRYAAAAITRLVRTGCRYSDITVAVRNIDDYAGYIKRIFPIYSIPVFADAKRPLSGHSVSLYVLSAMELAIYGFTNENVFTFAKNPFAPHNGQCGVLEDYCVEAGVRSWNWSEDFTFIRGAYSSLDYSGGDTKETMGETSPVKDDEAEMMDFINRRRKELWDLLTPLRQCMSKKRSGTEYAKGLYEFIEQSALADKTEHIALTQEKNGDLRGGSETRQVYNLIMDILEDVCTVFGGNEIDSEEFYDAIKTACSAVDVGVVPPVADSVVYGDIERMKGGRDKCVFVLGLNEDVFPRAFSNDSIFTEYETEALMNEWDIELPPGTVEKSENEKLLVYSAVSFPEERLYLCYSMGRSDGRNQRPSSVIKRVKELFPGLREQSDNDREYEKYLCATKEAAFLELGTAMSENRKDKFWSMLYNTLENDGAYAPKLRRLSKGAADFFADAEQLDSKLLAKVTGNELIVSPSRLETYGNCPYSYFLKYILRLREIIPFNINFVDSGNIMHNIIDGFCGRVVVDKNGDWSKVDDRYTQVTFESVCGEIRRGISRLITTDPRLKVTVERIEDAARKSIEEIRSQVQEELYVPVGHEVVIGQNGDIGPIEIPISGGRAWFTGRIDRADKRPVVYTDEKGNQRNAWLVRIIDYKNSSRELDLGKVLCGLQLQLFAYLDGYTSSVPDSIPAAALYFSLAPAVAKLPVEETQPPKVGRLKGIGIEGYMEYGDEINTVSSEEMKVILAYVRKSIRRAASRMKNGNIPISPFGDGDKLSCRFCPGGGVCCFDKTAQKERVRRPLRVKSNSDIKMAVEIMKNEITN